MRNKKNTLHGPKHAPPTRGGTDVWHRLDIPTCTEGANQYRLVCPSVPEAQYQYELDNQYKKGVSNRY